MAESFYTILTNIGKAQIANASALGTKVKFTTLKLGDSGGNYYNPTETQTALVHEVWSGNIGNIIVDTDNSNWIVLETVIPANVGGFMIRECGIADDEGNLLAVGKYPETYKPVVSEGSSKDLRIRTILEVVNTAAVTLKIDPTVTLATKEDLETVKDSIPKNASDIGAIANSQIGVTGGVAKQDNLTTLADDFESHKAENATQFSNINTAMSDMQFLNVRGCRYNG
ncbi:phage tail protein [Clostridium sp.]|uniref:phage tail protein n=1 Tax=Clostridium sp. TaxID=1506 RepID=UPI002FDDD29B